MKNILFVLPFLPYPLESGGHQAIFNGINAIKDDLNVFITFVDIDNEETRINIKNLSMSLDNKIKVLPLLYIEPSKFREGILDLIYKIKYKVKCLISNRPERKQKKEYEQWIKQLLPRNNEFLLYINKIIQEHNIDIVQCEMLETAHVVVSIPQNVQKVFVEHEIGFIRDELSARYSQNSTLLDFNYVQFCKGIEVALLNQFDSVITLSAIDKQKLLEAGVSTPMYTSLSIINTSIKEPSNTTVLGQNRLSFVGPEWHPSNKKGLLWFLEHCWGLLNNSDDYYLDIYGNWSRDTKEKVEKKYGNVHFCGFVKDLRYSMQNSIMIVPITIGSGIRMKILEAAAIGVPVVSTTIGAEGLPLKSGYNCYIADDAASFVQSIKALKDANTQKIFINNLQSTIKEIYTIERLRESRMIVYK